MNDALTRMNRTVLFTVSRCENELHVVYIQMEMVLWLRKKLIAVISLNHRMPRQVPVCLIYDDILSAFILSLYDMYDVCSVVMSTVLFW